jgi:signal transduction histidine kinase/BarA-like signal transduction histidine kinase
MNTVGDLTILAASLFMAGMFWAASRNMGRANQGTRLISLGLGVIAFSALIDATEILGPLPFAPIIGGPATEGLAYVGYSIGAVMLSFGLTRWLPLLKRLDREVAGRARAETDLNRALERARRFNAGFEALGKDHIQNHWSLEDLMEEATRRLSHMMGAARISVWSLDADGQALECLCLYERESQTHSRGIRLPRTTNPAYFEAIQTGSTVCVSDVLTDPVTRAFGPGYLIPLNIGAILDAPIRTGDGVRGVVCVEHVGAQHSWTSEEVSLASAVAQYIGVAMLADELAEAAQAARSANAAKSTFLANMSHELRTPLNGMLGMAEMIAEAASGRAQRDAVETLRSSGEQLLSVLNDVLDLSKIEAGQMQVRPEPTDIADLISQCAALFRPAAQKKGLRLELKLAALPDQIHADPVRVRQILSNLIANAVKFTEAGQVRIEASMEANLDSIHDDIAVDVVDTGCGISHADQERLFQRFTQLDASQTRSHGGSGLGLVIARELAQKMGGQIEFESTPGAGSRFTVRLPTIAVERAAESRDDATDLSLLEGAQVLVVDDNEVNRMVARCFLEALSVRVTEVDSGQAALDALEEQSFDLMLLDAHMPKMDGIETLKRVRALPVGDTLPVIAVTADALASDETRYMAAGMDGYIPKPIDKMRLIATCAEVLATGRRGDAVSAQTA